MPSKSVSLLAAIATVSLCVCLNARAEDKAEEASPEKARANFSRPIVLAADDVRHFPEPPDGFCTPRKDIVHGTTVDFNYDSKVTGRTRHARVYLPPGYNKERRYPVLYLLHGIAGNEFEWTWAGPADAILDNLIAEQKAVPMIIVMPNGRALPDDRAEGNPYTPEKVRGFEAFEKDLLENLIPAIEGHFSTQTDAAHRALAGLSMGGGQTLNFGFGNPGVFSWIGAFSPAPNTREPALLVKDPEQATKSFRLIYLSCGNKDGLINISQGVHRHLKQHQVPHIWNVDDHSHDRETWSSNLYRFAGMIFQ